MIRSFKSIIQTYSGKDKTIKKVFITPHNKEFSRIRNFVYPRLTSHHHLQGAKLKAATRLWKMVHEDFKKDLALYAQHYNKIYQSDMKSNVSGYNIFIKAVCKLPAPITNLTGSGGLISTIGPSISEWIYGGFLPPIRGVVFADADVETGN